MSTVTARKNRPAKSSEVVGNAIANESAKGSKPSKAERKAAKQAAEAKAAEAMAAMIAKMNANDAKTADDVKLLTVAATDVATTVDSLIARIYEPHSADAILAAMESAATVAAATGFDLFRLRCGYVQAIILRRVAEAKAANVVADKLTDEVAAAVSAAKLEAAKRLRLVRGQAADAAKANKQAAQQAAQLAQAGAVVFRMPWLRALAATATGEIAAAVKTCLSPFARFDGSDWRIVSLTATDKDGKALTLSAEDESKIRGIMERFASGELTTSDINGELVKAGLKSASKGGQGGGKGGKGGGKDDAEAANGVERVATLADYTALGRGATSEQAAAFCRAYFGGPAAANKIDARKLITELAALMG